MILRPEYDRYLRRLEPPRDPLLLEIEEEAGRRELLVSEPAVGKLLEVLALSSGAKRILEVGTGIGYSTVCLARGLAAGGEGGRILSVDRDASRQQLAAGFLARAELGDSVELVAGEALELLRDLAGPFDLIFLDADRQQYRRLLDLVLPAMRVGGTLVAASILGAGRLCPPADNPEDRDGEEVATDFPEDDPEVDALLAFNPYLAIHPQLRAVVLPLGGGVGLATKTRPTIREMGGPY